MNQKLTKDQIHFIDNYLKKSGVHFTDIRLEMLDHVASEIENGISNGDHRDFYFIFKDYMAEHKVSLLKESDRFYKASDKRILKSLLNNLFSFRGVFILITIFLSFKFMETILSLQQILSVLKYTPFSILIVGMIINSLLTRIKQERYSSLERLGLYFSVISQILYLFFNPILKIENFSSIKLLRMEMGASIIVLILIFLIASAFKFNKDYKIKYEISN